MFKLSRVASWNVVQRWVGIHNPLVHQGLQGCEVPWFVLFKPLACEGKSSKVFADCSVQLLCFLVLQAFWVFFSLEIDHVVTAVCFVLAYIAFASAAKSLDGVLLSFLHPSLVTIFDDGHLFTIVNLVSAHVVTI